MNAKKHYLKKTLDELGGEYAIEKDSNGFACAISKGGFHVLHLNPGTVRNAEFLPQIIDILRRNHVERNNMETKV